MSMTSYFNDINIGILSILKYRFEEWKLIIGIECFDSNKINKLCNKYKYQYELEIESKGIIAATILKNSEKIAYVIGDRGGALLLYNKIDIDFKQLYDFLIDKQLTFDQKIDLYVPDVNRGSGEVKFNQRNINGERFGKIDDFLYPNIDINILAEEYLKSYEPILIITGEPGCGKTTFGKFLLRTLSLIKHKEKRNAWGASEPVRVVNTNNINVLEKPNFWNKILEGDNDIEEIDVLFLDDVALSLIRDNKTKNEFVDNLLALSGGIVDPKLKILITTNQNKVKIDKAILRPGRCFDNIILNPLTNEEAENIWVNKYKQNREYFIENIFRKDLDYITQANIVSHYRSITTSVSKKNYYKENKTVLV